MRPDGGIGRRAGLKHQWGNPSRFDPGSGYKEKVKRFLLSFDFFRFSGEFPQKHPVFILPESKNDVFLNRKPSKGIQNNPNIIIPFMRKAFILPALIAAGLAAQSCQQKNQEKNMEEEVTADTTAVSAKVASCNVRMDGITFTGALNGADTCVTVKDGRAIEFRCRFRISGKH